MILDRPLMADDSLAHFWSSHGSFLPGSRARYGAASREISSLSLPTHLANFHPNCVITIQSDFRQCCTYEMPPKRSLKGRKVASKRTKNITDSQQHEAVDRVQDQRRTSSSSRRVLAQAGCSGTNLSSLPQEILDLVLDNVGGHKNMCYNRADAFIDTRAIDPTKAGPDLQTISSSHKTTHPTISVPLR